MACKTMVLLFGALAMASGATTSGGSVSSRLEEDMKENMIAGAASLIASQTSLTEEQVVTGINLAGGVYSDIQAGASPKDAISQAVKEGVKTAVKNGQLHNLVKAAVKKAAPVVVPQVAEVVIERVADRVKESGRFNPLQEQQIDLVAAVSHSLIEDYTAGASPKQMALSAALATLANWPNASVAQYAHLAEEAETIAILAEKAHAEVERVQAVINRFFTEEQQTLVVQVTQDFVNAVKGGASPEDAAQAAAQQIVTYAMQQYLASLVPGKGSGFGSRMPAN
jgi:hypothetical protein